MYQRICKLVSKNMNTPYGKQGQIMTGNKYIKEVKVAIYSVKPNAN